MWCGGGFVGVGGCWGVGVVVVMVMVFVVAGGSGGCSAGESLSNGGSYNR